MNSTKDILITGFALFSLFFGAGNLILPPFLGSQAGDDWFLVAFGFTITAVIVPILGIVAYARLQGTMLDFGKKVSPVFSFIYCVIVYAVAVALPGPRTASVTHEMAIAPFFETSSLVTSSVYFILVFLFAINRSKILDLLGKFLTPLIIIILLVVIGVGVFTSPGVASASLFKTPIIGGLLEGYQTFDAIAAVVVGGVLVVSINLKSSASFEVKKELIIKSGILAGLGLMLIYAGLIYNGNLFSSLFPENATRTEMLSSLSVQTLGYIGTAFLSVLVALACFTTAVGIVTGTSDFVKGLCKDSQIAYVVTAILTCLVGVAVGQFNVDFIIDIALPALMFVYPITIVLILLNALPERYASVLVFRTVVLMAFLFSIPDFLKFLIPVEYLEGVIEMIPFAKDSLGWVLPALLTFVIVNMFDKKKALI